MLVLIRQMIYEHSLCLVEMTFNCKCINRTLWSCWSCTALLQSLMDTSLEQMNSPCSRYTSSDGVHDAKNMSVDTSLQLIRWIYIYSLKGNLRFNRTIQFDICMTIVSWVTYSKVTDNSWISITKSGDCIQVIVTSIRMMFAY